MCRSLRDYAERKFRRDGVTLRAGSKIVAVGEDWLEVDGVGRGVFSDSPAYGGIAAGAAEGRRFESGRSGQLTVSEPFGLLVWSTGLAANPFVQRLEGVSHDDKTSS